MKSKSKVGVCSLCGNIGKLSFEHIPPKSAFNNSPIRMLTKDWLYSRIGKNKGYSCGIDGAPYRIHQKGSGLFSICQKCNHNTGSWYGQAYKEFAYIAADIMLQEETDTCTCVKLQSIYPLRVVKQVLSMFCSLNGTFKEMQEIRSFVLDKESIGLPKEKYRLCMYYTKSQLSRLQGMFFKCHTDTYGTITQMASEIAAAPLGFILYMYPKTGCEYLGYDITSFSNYGYNELCDVVMPLLVYEVNSTTPLDFRTKEEILRDTQDNGDGITH